MTADPLVRHFRQVLIWPLQLMPMPGAGLMGQQWQAMQALARQGSPWQPRPTEFHGDPAAFQERHYREFVTFLPYVQRFLYGEGGSECTDAASAGKSPLHVFRRTDVQRVRVTLADGAPIELQVAHIDLYFFFDLDIAILAFEVMGGDEPLSRVQDLLYRFGRAYPAQWDDDGSASNCPRRVEWLDADGVELAVSDYEARSEYLSHMGTWRAPRMAAHWDWLLQPMALHHSEDGGGVRYRQLEYHRMPLMAYLAVDDPFALSEEQFYRLGMVTRPSEGLPHSTRIYQEFLRDCCFERFWSPDRSDAAASTRMLCNGYAFVVVGMHGNPFFANALTGVLGQFRHQYFLLTLIAHFHKAVLLLFSERLAGALARLNVHDPLSVRLFKRETRILMAVFLRFTQRYWFREVSNQLVADKLFVMLRHHLDTQALFDEVRESMQRMNQYLENDDLRRQADTVVRLTVVTILGLIGTTATGFLGMNIFDLAAEPGWKRFLYFMAALVPTSALTFYTLLKSRGLSEFLDSVSDERVPWRWRIKAFLGIWKRRRRASDQRAP
ncbi:hypothetical protein [Chitinolyticbacter meiyuanensis]|uniref:hypothetical protein n=1 Tax=Chitinolyticbacter meiyuanensis TaxID=682798 RepID=UPI0011E5DB76|nr:hypothetical protein [Chitinolyticbacter meiyuanensis]